MQDKKSSIRKIITIAVFVLLLIGAVYFYFSAPDNSENSDYSSENVFSESSEYPTVTDSSTDGNNILPSEQDSQPSESESSEYPTVAESSPDGNNTLPSEQDSQQPSESDSCVVQYTELKFRNSKLLNQHYEKHGIEMGFSSAEEYEKAAVAVLNNPNVLHKTEKEDGDDVYYVEATNEFVVVSTDGYLRTYFLPDAGKSYFDRQ